MELRGGITIYPLTAEIADLAGEISGDAAERGVKIPFEDLLIGATALHLGYEVITGNVKHFAMIPNLSVKQL